MPVLTVYKQFILFVRWTILKHSPVISDELQFDPTVSSGHFGQLGEGGFRSTPITVGVCPTPQPAPTPRPEPQVKQPPAR